MERKAWECPVCHVGVAPHCDTCPNCVKPLDLQGIPIRVDPTLPRDDWRISPTPSHDQWVKPYNPWEMPRVRWVGEPAITTGGTSLAVLIQSPSENNIEFEWRITQ